MAAVGQKRARNLEYSCAAAVVGMGEIVFLPFDTLKVREWVCRLELSGLVLVLNRCFCWLQILYQTNPGSVQGRSLLEVARVEGIRKLYRCVYVCVRVCVCGGGESVGVSPKEETAIHPINPPAESNPLPHEQPNIPIKQRGGVDGRPQRPGQLRALRRQRTRQGAGTAVLCCQLCCVATTYLITSVDRPTGPTGHTVENRCSSWSATRTPR